MTCGSVEIIFWHTSLMLFSYIQYMTLACGRGGILTLWQAERHFCSLMAHGRQRQYCRLAITCLLTGILSAQMLVNVQWDLPLQLVRVLLNINEQNHVVRPSCAAGIPKYMRHAKCQQRNPACQIVLSENKSSLVPFRVLKLKIEDVLLM